MRLLLKPKIVFTFHKKLLLICILCDKLYYDNYIMYLFSLQL